MKQFQRYIYLVLFIINTTHAMDTPPHINTDKTFATLQCMQGIINDQRWLVDASIAQGIDPLFEKPEEPYKYYNVLQLACSKTNLAAVERILDIEGLDIHRYNEKTCAPIQFALLRKDYPILTSLLQHPSAQINKADNCRNSFLHIASSQGNVEFVKALFACKSIDVNIRDKEGNTPLMLAVKKNHKEIVTVILAHPTRNINVTDNGRNSPLSHSCWEDSHEITELLLAEKDIRVDKRCHTLGNSALHAAACRNGKCLALLLNHPSITAINTQNYEGDTPLHLACENDNHNAMQLLVQKGANTTIRNHRRMTPLVISYVKKEGLFRFNSQTGQPTAINTMIQDKDADNNTQLHLATEITTLKHTVLEKYLRDIATHSSTNIVCIKARNNHGQTAIDLAYEHYYKKQQEYVNEKTPGRKKFLTNQEKTLHTFLRITAPAMDTPCALFIRALACESHETSLPWEIKQLIARKYCELNVEKIIAKKDTYQNEYYSDYIENKNRLKKDARKDPKALHLLWK